MFKLSLTFFYIFFASALLSHASDRSARFLPYADNGFKISGKVFEAQDVSGIARGDDGAGLLVSDERATVQLLKFPKLGTAEIIKDFRLDTDPDAECDFEGAAFTRGHFIVTGSHGLSKKKGNYERSRHRVYRLRPNASSTALASVEKSSLDRILASDPTLAPFNRKPLQRSGINIEGLAARDGVLFFGLRNPSVDGHAFVVEVGADALFHSTEPDYTLHKLKLDDGLGIREIAALDDGAFFVLTGNAGSESNDKFPRAENHAPGRGYHLFHWLPGSEPSLLGSVPDPPGKAEALLVLNQAGGKVDLAVLYDSAPSGRPQRFLVPLPSEKSD